MSVKKEGKKEERGKSQSKWSLLTGLCSLLSALLSLTENNPRISHL